MYQPPTFNIVVTIQHAVAAYEWTEEENSVAQLKGINSFRAGGAPGGPSGLNALYELKLPAGTDIRDASNLAFSDRVVIDGFSAPLLVFVVYDVAFGFDNEYRVALLTRQVLPSPAYWSRLPGQGVTPQPI